MITAFLGLIFSVLIWVFSFVGWYYFNIDAFFAIIIATIGLMFFVFSFERLQEIEDQRIERKRNNES